MQAESSISSIQIEHTAAAWLARRDAGAWTARDQDSFDAWLAQSTAHRVAWIRLDAAWRESGRLQALGAGRAADAGHARASWARLSSDNATTGHDPAATLVFAARRKAPPRRGRRIGWLAAALAATLGGVVLWQGALLDPAVQATTYRTALGGMESVPLADGTQAMLSSNSSIAFALTRRERMIDLERGEAFFHAAKDPARPFVVAAGRYRAVAVGTRFAVRRDRDGMRVVVTEGRVRLESVMADGEHQAGPLLSAGSVAIVNGDGLLVHTGTVAEAEQALSWRDGFLTFRDTPLAMAAAEFNRYNQHKILVEDPGIAELRIGGNFRWGNTDAFIRLLEQAFPVRAERRGDTTVLHQR